MLVLSRRPDEKILLPTVPAVIKVISSQAGLVRLGVEAPSHVPILREELCRSASARPRDGLGPAESPTLRHAVRNRLNNLILGMTLLRMQLADQNPEVQKTLAGIEDELQALRSQVVAPPPDAGKPAASADLLAPSPAG
jgi:carbon storage regulator CsrA